MQRHLGYLQLGDSGDDFFRDVVFVTMAFGCIIWCTVPISFYPWPENMITCEIKLCLVSGLYCHKSAKSTQGLTHEVREYIWPFWSKVLVIKTN